MTSEKRHFTRIPFNATAAVTHMQSGTNWMCELVDISLKGVLISKPDDWQGSENEKFTIKLQLAGEEVELNFEVLAVHADAEHIGFKIEHMDIDSATHLHRLVELNLGNEALLERELSELIQA